jgi:lipopolysaccharide biosynthesis glycosyltransferase
MDTDIIPIVFTCNNFFVPYLSAMIQSIVENSNKQNMYTLYVLHKDISEKNMQILTEQLYEYKNFSINYINVLDYIKKYSLFIGKIIPVETYFSLLIPYLFKDHNKVIYLDCDMICNADIAELYKVNIDGYLLAAVRDILNIRNYYILCNKYKIKKYFRSIHIKNIDDYFICGTVIYNIKLFNSFISLEDMFKLAVSCHWKYQEQDILNYLCQNKILFLPFEWNIIMTPVNNKFPENIKNEYKAARQNPKIIHYAADNKPWNNYFHKPYFELFWMYAVRSKYINDIINRMYDKNLIDVSIYHRIQMDFFSLIRNIINLFRKYIPI